MKRVSTTSTDKNKKRKVSTKLVVGSPNGPHTIKDFKGAVLDALRLGR